MLMLMIRACGPTVWHEWFMYAGQVVGVDPALDVAAIAKVILFSPPRLRRRRHSAPTSGAGRAWSTLTVRYPILQALHPTGHWRPRAIRPAAKAEGHLALQTMAQREIHF